MVLPARNRRHRSHHIGAAVFALVCAGLLAALPLKAGGKNKLPKESRRSETHEIEALEQQWRTALLSGNASMLDSVLADDFLAISSRGTLSDKQQYIQHIAAHTTRLISLDVTDMKVRAKPTSAVVVLQAHVVGTLEGRPIQGVFLYTKVYSREPSGAWRMTNFEATRVSAPHTAKADGTEGVSPSAPPVSSTGR